MKLKQITISIVTALTLGGLCGIIGTLFSETIFFVTKIRTQNSWLLFLLPIAGLAIVAIYRLLKTTDIGTKRTFAAAISSAKVPPLLLPAIFLGTALTHICGGSAGKEGAALQIGGSVSAIFCNILKLNSSSKKTMTLCGMAALFSAVFGTPLAAAIFVFEALRLDKSRFKEFFQVLLSSLIAYGVSYLLKAHHEKFGISLIPDINYILILKILLICAMASAIGVLFCISLKYTAKLLKKLIRNDYMRIAIGGTIVVLISLLIKTRDYNGSSIEILSHIFEKGEVKYEAFALKLILTSITMSSGYRGGEIVPTLFIGASLGGAIAHLLAIPISFGAAIGMAVLFSTVTKCPLTALFLCIELFSAKGIIFIMFAIIISIFLSGNYSIYGNVAPLPERYHFRKNGENL